MRLAARRPVIPRAPPSSPRNLGPTYIKNQNAEKLAEVCRDAPAHLRRNLSFSSEGSVPGLTDEHTDSDASMDEERYQANMTDLWNTYHDLSNSTRLANQEYVQAPRKVIRKDVKPLDRTWASELSSTLDIPMPSPGTPAFALQMQLQQLELIQPQDVRRELRQASSHHNLRASRSTRRNPAVLASLVQPPMPTQPVPAAPHSAPLPSSTYVQPQLPLSSASSVRSQSRPRANTAFDTWPPRSDSAVTVPTMKTFAPESALPTLRRPSRVNLAADYRPSTAPDQRSASSLSNFDIPPVPALEKSVWEYDEDDIKSAKKGHGKGEGSFSKMMHLRNLSGGSSKTVKAIVSVSEVQSPVEKKKRSASDILRFFGISKK